VSEQAETQTALGRLAEALQLEQRKQAFNCCGTAGTASRTHSHGDANEFCWGFPRASDSSAGFKDYLTGSLQDLAAAAEQRTSAKGERRIAKSQL